MKYLNFFITVILATVFILSSCTKDEFQPENIDIQDEFNIKQNEGQIILGEQLKDPYKLENMIKAYESLKSSNSGTADTKIKANYKYIRFLPNDDDEWDILKSDTTLILYDFPLDYEIKNMGTYYHDPSLPKDAITWQYSVVPIGYSAPNIYTELLYEVYIPGKGKGSSKSSAGLSQFLIDLEHESVKLTGNLPQDGSENTKSLKASKWTPQGKIEVWDNIIGNTITYTKVFDHWEYYDCDGDDPQMETKMIVPIEQCKRAVYRYIRNETQGMYIPLIGANVHARWFTHIETDVTDNDGKFATEQFRYEVNYAIKWERGHYDIRNGNILQAWYNGPKKKGDWNVKINGGESIMYATIHRGAYKHFYGDNLGIRRPILSDGSKTKLCYIDKEGTGVFWGDWDGTGAFPTIKIWGKSTHTHTYKPIDQVLGTTIHELGHQSHSQYMGNIQFVQASKLIRESWADAVEWALTNDEYHSMGERFGGQAAIDYNSEWTNQFDWPDFVNDRAYSPIFIDLMDDQNQRNDVFDINGFRIHRGRITCPNDLISDYTLSYIQNNILGDSYGLTSLNNAIKNNRINGVTNADVDQLFALYW